MWSEALHGVKRVKLTVKLEEFRIQRWRDGLIIGIVLVESNTADGEHAEAGDTNASLTYASK